jgi:hypothetical protein
MRSVKKVVNKNITLMLVKGNQKFLHCRSFRIKILNCSNGLIHDMSSDTI